MNKKKPPKLTPDQEKKVQKDVGDMVATLAIGGAIRGLMKNNKITIDSGHDLEETSYDPGNIPNEWRVKCSCGWRISAPTAEGLIAPIWQHLKTVTIDFSES